ncbi:MAG TPA: hypothetical protein VKP88_01250 [Candidatus Paceibacterota bacterium]|nr:hypothetical protein [Candidatus Paceibacterota bacterium]
MFTLTETEAKKMMAKSAISMLKDSLRIYFSNVHFTYKTSTKEGVSTLVVTYAGQLDVDRFAQKIEAAETNYLQVFFKRDKTQIF